MLAKADFRQMGIQPSGFKCSGTLRASLSVTFLPRKDVVNQCLEFDAVFDEMCLLHEARFL